MVFSFILSLGNTTERRPSLALEGNLFNMWIIDTDLFYKHGLSLHISTCILIKVNLRERVT